MAPHASPSEEVAQHFRLPRRGHRRASPPSGTAADARRRRPAPPCRERSRVGSAGSPQRIEPRATWDDLVLPERPAHCCARSSGTSGTAPGLRGLGLRRGRSGRGLGVTALFAGESGTGKTMAAEVLAGALGLDLYRIDLVGRGQQVHRRDREEPPARLRRGRGERRRPALRRGRRALRQAQRGQGQPRPLREPRGHLPAAAHGGLPRPRDPHDQPARQRRPRVPAAPPLRRRSSRSPTSARAPRSGAGRSRGERRPSGLDPEALSLRHAAERRVDPAIALSAAFAAAEAGRPSRRRRCCTRPGSSTRSRSALSPTPRPPPCEAVSHDAHRPANRAPGAQGCASRACGGARPACRTAAGRAGDRRPPRRGGSPVGQRAAAARAPRPIARVSRRKSLETHGHRRDRTSGRRYLDDQEPCSAHHGHGCRRRAPRVAPSRRHRAPGGSGCGTSWPAAAA